MTKEISILLQLQPALGLGRPGAPPALSLWGLALRRAQPTPACWGVGRGHAHAVGLCGSWAPGAWEDVFVVKVLSCSFTHSASIAEHLLSARPVLRIGRTET